MLLCALNAEMSGCVERELVGGGLRGQGGDGQQGGAGAEQCARGAALDA
jgi:hypothetical protein